MNNIYTGMLHKLLTPVAANVPPLLDDPWPPAGAPTVCKVKTISIHIFTACMGLVCY